MILQRSFPIRSLDLVGCRITLKSKDLVRVNGWGLFDVRKVTVVVVIFGAGLGGRFRGFLARARHCNCRALRQNVANTKSPMFVGAMRRFAQLMI